jgi:hypothetical protein
MHISIWLSFSKKMSFQQDLGMKTIQKELVKASTNFRPPLECMNFIGTVYEFHIKQFNFTWKIIPK